MKIYKALVEFEKTCPELFYLIKNCKIEPENVPTAYAKKLKKAGFKIGINTEWVESFDQHSLCAILEHELLHIVLEHCATMGEYKNPRLANVAMDCIINDIGHYFQDKNKLNKELQAGVFIENINKRYAADFNTHRDTALDIYDFISRLDDKEKEKLGGSSFDEGLDVSGAAGDGDEGEEAGDIEADLDAAAGTIKGKIAPQDGQNQADGKGGVDLEEILSPDELKDIFKAYGKKSPDVRKFLEAIEKKEKNRKIKNAIEQFFNSHRAEVKKSLKKLNKRFSFLPYGRQKDGKQKILLALDVSGSMLNPEDLAKIKMSVVSATNNGFSVDLMFGDTEKLGEFKDIKSSFDFSKIHGGGGTDLSFIFEDKRFNSYDCYVIVTDGYFDWNDIPKKLRHAILFLNTTDRPVEGFKNLHI